MDSTLALPPRVSPVPRLLGPSDTLTHAGLARPRPFLLAVAGASARGVESRAVDGVELGGVLLLGRLAVAGASYGNVLFAPGQARRELAGLGAALFETLLITPDGLIGQWTRAPGVVAEEARLELALPGSSWRAEGSFFRADDGHGVRLIQVLPAPVWSVRAGAGELMVTAAAAAGEDAPLLMLVTTAGDAVAAEARLERLARARETLAEARLIELRTRRLAIRTGVDELDDGLAWAVARVDAASGPGGDPVHELAIGEPPPCDPDSRRAWTALGALASGSRSPPFLPTGSHMGVVARARAAAWRGKRIASTRLPALSVDAPAPAAAQDIARCAALLAIADAVEPWEGRERADALRAQARLSGAGRSALVGGHGVRFPTLGAFPSAGEPHAAALAAALELPGRPRYTPPTADPPPGLLRALTAWACFNEGELDRGFALFRRHLADGFADGVGLWTDGARIHDPAAAALVPLVLLDGLLGARADAHYGRLRLAPRLPPHWTRLSVSGIIIGDATVRMDYEGTGGTHHFRLVQESGAVPLMLVFEPILAVATGAPVRVDGRTAELDALAVGKRVQVRIQMPLDRERSVTVG